MIGIRTKDDHVLTAISYLDPRTEISWVKTPEAERNPNMGGQK
jgi:hypothetical protein